MRSAFRPPMCIPLENRSNLPDGLSPHLCRRDRLGQTPARKRPASATARLTWCTKCATPYPAIVRTLRKIFDGKDAPIFSATRTLPSRSVLSTNPDSSGCRMTTCPAGSRGCTARRCGRIDTGSSRFPHGFHAAERAGTRFAKTSKNFHTVDLLRSPSAPFERPLTLRLKQPARRCTAPPQAGVSSCSSRSETHRASC